MRTRSSAIYSLMPDSLQVHYSNSPPLWNAVVCYATAAHLRQTWSQTHCLSRQSWRIKTGSRKTITPNRWKKSVILDMALPATPPSPLLLLPQHFSTRIDCRWLISPEYAVDRKNVNPVSKTVHNVCHMCRQGKNCACINIYDFWEKSTGRTR